MITHYDMVTGDIIDNDAPAVGAKPYHEPHTLVETRLLSIDEARLCDPHSAVTGPALVMLPISQLLGD